MKPKFIKIAFLSVIASCHANTCISESKVSKFSIENATINSIHYDIVYKNVSCKKIISEYLSRIYRYNLNIENSLPPINAISELNLSVLDDAEKLDKQKKPLFGRLFCIPVVIKDNIDVLGMETAAGSYALIGSKPLKDADLVSLLRQEGAIIIAKTSMDELAMGANGISSLSGRIGNPYNTLLNPGGSSGGSAAAMSANFGIIAIGTDNSGSVRIPAAFNGLYGLRPTQGLISNTGIFPMGNIDGTAGPLARTVTDLATSLTVLAKNTPPIEYTKYLNTNTLSGKTIAIIHKVGTNSVWKNMPAFIKNVYNMAINNLKNSGVKIVNLDLPEFDNNRNNNMAGTIEDVNEYLKINLTTRNNMEELCRSNRSRVMGNEKACLNFIKYIAKKESIEYKKVLSTIKYNLNYVTGILRNKHIDALLLPISNYAGNSYDMLEINTWQSPISSNSNLPSITIPIGQTNDKLQIGMEIVAGEFREDILLMLAYNYEQKYRKFTPPELKASDMLNKLSIPELNLLFRQIGKNSYLEFITPHNKNTISPSQAYQAVVQSIFEISAQ